MSNRFWLCLYHDLSNPESGHTVRIECGDPLTTQKTEGLILCSLSPIFPVSGTPFLPVHGQPYEIAFVVHENAFVQIGKQNPERQKFLWYTLGITAIVGITPFGAARVEILEQLEPQGMLCSEVWPITAEGLGKPDIKMKLSQSVGQRHDLPEALPQDQDVKHIIRELYLNFNSLIKRSRTLIPSLLPTVGQMRLGAAREIGKLVQAEENLRVPTRLPASPAGSSMGSPGPNHLAVHKRANLSIDALVQLNSGLAYIISQTFYGGPPILRNLALNSCHSLLGIGTAIKAIQRLTDFIIEGFAEHPISTIIETFYGETTLATHLAPDSSSLNRKTVDHFQSRVGRREQTPKLAYFSTRMGFSEHAYCVTAATQCLASADAARRNLLTLTHELLHSHVKGLFASMLAGKSNGEEPQLKNLVQDYRKKVVEAAGEADCKRNWSILEFLRYRIFAFCDGIQKVVSEHPACRDDGPLARIVSASPDVDDDVEVGRFKSSFEFMNELVVHVLDLHYFYDESDNIYLATLWRSWATVPGVADHIEWYILRSIVAISVINIDSLCAQEFGDLGDLVQPHATDLQKRFEDSLNAATSILEELCSSERSAPMLYVVLERLKDQGTKAWLRHAFFPCHLFAQNVKQFLYSPELRNYFDSYHDPLADRDSSNDPVYRLESMEFPSGPIRNPIAMLRDRLRRDLSRRDSTDEEERSAWLFLALSSVQIPDHSNKTIKP